ncbi:universal stress protein [Natrialbaceae archaeon GCM10025810]|uniref:universal stress protein n=1 Tax=Halovalidus salilacus TaxID=3075124 RepID=UPI0036187D4E
MDRRILVPIDGSSQSWAALEHAATNFEGERIVALHVVDPVEGVYTGSEGGFYDPGAYDRAVERGEELCEDARERLEGFDAAESTSFETEVVTGRPAPAIIEYAEENDVDHIVMGSHGRSGVSRILLGSIAETVMRRATVPVTVVR